MVLDEVWDEHRWSLDFDWGYDLGNDNILQVQNIFGSVIEKKREKLKIYQVKFEM